MEPPLFLALMSLGEVGDAVEIELDRLDVSRPIMTASADQPHTCNWVAF